MKYLKYFENSEEPLWSKMSPGDRQDFVKGKTRLVVDEKDRQRISDLLLDLNISGNTLIGNANRLPQNDGGINTIMIEKEDETFDKTFGGEIFYRAASIAFYSDDWFIFAKGGRNYLVDGWDGLEDIVNSILK